MISAKRRGMWVVNLAEIIALLLLMILISMTLVYLVFSAIAFSVDSFDAEARVFATSLLYSKNGLAYYDSAHDRTYPGIVDMTRFPYEESSAIAVEDKYTDIIEKQLNESFALIGTRGKLGAKIFIDDNSGRFLFLEFYYNEKLYREFEPLAGLWEGPGGSKKEVYVYHIKTIYSDGRMFDGTMEVEVVGPNS